MKAKKSLLITTVSVLLGGAFLSTGTAVYASEIENDTVTEISPTTSPENSNSIDVEDEVESDAEFDTYIQEILFNDDFIVPEEETDDVDVDITEEEQNEIINSTVLEVQNTATVIPEVPGQMQTRGAVGLMAKLIAKYGVIYVKKTLPKIMYKKVAPYIGKKITQAKFLTIWNNIVNLGTGAAAEKGLAKVFKSLGISSGVANTAASVIVTALFLLI